MPINTIIEHLICERTNGPSVSLLHYSFAKRFAIHSTCWGKKASGIQSLMYFASVRRVRSDAARIMKPDVMFDNSIIASEVTSHKINLHRVL